MLLSKGGILLSAQGILQIRTYTSRAQIPVEGVSISVKDAGGKLLATRITDRSGTIAPISISVPALEESLEPDFPGQPFTDVTISAFHPGYEKIEAARVQLFPGIVTMQELELIPLAEFPGLWSQTEYLDTPPQNL